MLLSKSHNLLKELERGNRAGGVIWIIQPHQFCPVRDLIRDRVQIRQEGIFRQERHGIGLSLGRWFAPDRIDWVGAGIGEKNEVTGIDQDLAEIKDPFLRTD